METICSRCGEDFLPDGTKRICPDCQQPDPDPVDCYRYQRRGCGSRIEEGFKYIQD